MGIHYRAATSADLGNVAHLLDEYMQETYHGLWHGTVERLRSDAFGSHFSLTLAAAPSALVGFAAWRSTYDLHHCLPGVEVVDMFVRRPDRGRGIAACLLASVAAQSRHAGATFMTGGAVGTGAAAQLYARATVCHGDQSYLSGRAFREFAALAGASARDLVGRLPPLEWNHQP
jgi:GNAT superfamily N-acetyltransferase